MTIIRPTERVTKIDECGEYRVTIPPLNLCVCGTEFQIHDWFATSCPSCGREYNGAGQLLAPRSQWGKETGERF